MVNVTENKVACVPKINDIECTCFSNITATHELICLSTSYCAKKKAWEQCSVDMECEGLRCDQGACSQTKLYSQLKRERRNLQSISRSSSSRSSSSSSSRSSSSRTYSSVYVSTGGYYYTSSSGSATGAIVGPIVSVLFVLVMIGICVYRLKKSGQLDHILSKFGIKSNSIQNNDNGFVGAVPGH